MSTELLESTGAADAEPVEAEIQKEEKSASSPERETYLFVCTGNTCRSPMVQAVFNAKYANETRKAESAGLSANREPISTNAKCALMEDGILPTREYNYLNHTSKRLDERLMKRATHVVAVSSTHAMHIISRFPAYASKISVLPLDIPDPFGGDMAVYKRCLDRIKKALCIAFDSEDGALKSCDDF